MQFYAAIWRPDYDNSGNMLTPEQYSSLLDCIDVTKTLQFGTQLHGGYGSCSFSIPAPTQKAGQIFRIYLGTHVVIFDVYARRLYEGFITNTSLQVDGVGVTAVGYYAKADNHFSDMIYPFVDPTTNQIINPSFEVNVTTGWTLTGSGAAARSTTEFFSGTASAKLTQATSGTTSFTSANIAQSAAITTYAVSLYAKKLDIVETPNIVVYESNGGVTFTTAKTLALSGLDTSWRRYELTFDTLATTTHVKVVIELPPKSGSGSAGSFYIDAVQAEQKSYVTPYCDGSLGGDNSWTGTANASTSTRVDSNPTTIYTVISDAVDLVPEWNGNKGFLKDADYQVGGQDYTDKKVKESIESVLTFGFSETNVNPAYFAIWNNRIPYLFAEPTSTVTPDWLISVYGLRNQSGMELSLDNMYNRVWAVYDDQGAGPSKTATPAEDYLSIHLYGVREGILQNSSLPSANSDATTFQNMALERYRYPRTVISIEVSGLITSGAGFKDYPYQIRAGQQILITDMDMLIGTNGLMSGQASKGFSGFVLRTEYNASSNSMRIEFGVSDISFETLMGRLGLSGGLA